MICIPDAEELMVAVLFLCVSRTLIIFGRKEGSLAPLIRSASQCTKTPSSVSVAREISAIHHAYLTSRSPSKFPASRFICWPRQSADNGSLMDMLSTSLALRCAYADFYRFELLRDFCPIHHPSDCSYHFSICIKFLVKWANYLFGGFFFRGLYFSWLWR